MSAKPNILVYLDRGNFENMLLAIVIDTKTEIQEKPAGCFFL